MITYSEHTDLAACEAQDQAAIEALVLTNTFLAGSMGIEAIRRPADAQATRFQTNPNWSYRGDNTKYRSTK